jgi:hypothetical protein
MMTASQISRRARAAAQDRLAEMRPFRPFKVETGMTFRKDGPNDWWRVVRTQLPGDRHYDGGLPGVSVRVSKATHILKDGSWGQSWGSPVFVPATSGDDFLRKAKDGYRRLVESPR